MIPLLYAQSSMGRSQPSRAPISQAKYAHEPIQKKNLRRGCEHRDSLTGALVIAWLDFKRHGKGSAPKE
jgi:hypothetical protein